jgi:hypothetical protein
MSEDDPLIVVTMEINHKCLDRLYRIMPPEQVAELITPISKELATFSKNLRALHDKAESEARAVLAKKVVNLRPPENGGRDNG